MSEIAEKLKTDLATLSLEDRDSIRDYLDSLDDEEMTQDEWEEAWSAEINRRIADVEAGRSKLIPGDEVFRRVDEMLARLNERKP